MKFRLDYISDGDYFYAKTWGRTKHYTFSGLPPAVISHQNWCKGMNVLIDHSDLVIDECPPCQIKEIALYDSIFHEQFTGSKIALVARQTQDLVLPKTGKKWSAS